MAQCFPLQNPVRVLVFIEFLSLLCLFADLHLVYLLYVPPFATPGRTTALFLARLKLFVTSPSVHPIDGLPSSWCQIPCRMTDYPWYDITEVTEENTTFCSTRRSQSPRPSVDTIPRNYSANYSSSQMSSFSTILGPADTPDEQVTPNQDESASKLGVTSELSSRELSSAGRTAREVLSRKVSDLRTGCRRSLSWYLCWIGL